jgi:sugar/nucleoside kinase (ribokinase family)
LIEIVTVGWLTIDDIVLPDGSCERRVLGGGALYSAVGSAIWNDHVGVHSVTGRKHISDVVSRIDAFGLGTRGINAIEGNGLELWLLHESQDEKQQVPKLVSSTAKEMDEGRAPLPEEWRGARGVHIAPQSPLGSFANIAALSALDPRPVMTMDILSDGYVAAEEYRDLAFIDELDAFLPSEAEIVQIWRPSSLSAWIAAQATQHGCHMAAKLGSAGSLVCAAGTDAVMHVPIFPASVIDTTGAGDAYCGGFIAGLIDGRPPVECAAMGTVSASFVIEARGALATRRPDRTTRDARLRQVLAGVRPRCD